MSKPILYSFRRCPYAMRARLALFSQNIAVELREVVLRDKPDSMLEASPKGTVPVLVLSNGQVIEESLDVMKWAISQSVDKPFMPTIKTPTSEMSELIDQMDGHFKHNLDRYKYANRYDGVEALPHREANIPTLEKLDEMLIEHNYLFDDQITFADIAIAPFIRQFANTDKDWFFKTPYTNLHRWLIHFCDSQHFTSIMEKYPQWQPGDVETTFPHP